MNSQPYGPITPYLGGIVLAVLMIGFVVSMIIEGREKGRSPGESLEPFTTIFRAVGLILKWIFKGLGFLLVFIFALSRKEAPPSSGTSGQEENLDEFEDDEEKPRKQRKIDEYHV